MYGWQFNQAVDADIYIELDTTTRICSSDSQTETWESHGPGSFPPEYGRFPSVEKKEFSPCCTRLFLSSLIRSVFKVATCKVATYKAATYKEARLLSRQSDKTLLELLAFEIDSHGGRQFK
jgi:hypothetical protein